MTDMELITRVRELEDRLNLLYKWYKEKMNKGWHSEFTFDYLKKQIAETSITLEEYRDVLNAK